MCCHPTPFPFSKSYVQIKTNFQTSNIIKHIFLDLVAKTNAWFLKQDIEMAVHLISGVLR